VRGSKAFSSGISLYAVADGHNGCAAARFVSTILPAELEQQLGSAPGDQAVRKALARTFLAVDEKVTQQLVQSGEACSGMGVA
jgi:serine/threonine protein phosphatase PrpC